MPSQLIHVVQLVCIHCRNDAILLHFARASRQVRQELHEDYLYTLQMWHAGIDILLESQRWEKTLDLAPLGSACYY